LKQFENIKKQVENKLSEFESNPTPLEGYSQELENKGLEREE
jgi:hypothetical protein